MTTLIAWMMTVLMMLSDGSAYMMQAEIVEVTNDTVVAESYDGNLWAVYADGYALGDIVDMVMDTNGTLDNIYDDECIFIQKNA